MHYFSLLSLCLHTNKFHVCIVLSFCVYWCTRVHQLWEQCNITPSVVVWHKVINWGFSCIRGPLRFFWLHIFLSMNTRSGWSPKLSFYLTIPIIFLSTFSFQFLSSIVYMLRLVIRVEFFEEQFRELNLSMFSFCTRPWTVRQLVLVFFVLLS